MRLLSSGRHTQLSNERLLWGHLTAALNHFTPVVRLCLSTFLQLFPPLRSHEASSVRLYYLIFLMEILIR